VHEPDTAQVRSGSEARHVTNYASTDRDDDCTAIRSGTNKITRDSLYGRKPLR
jgi:hypothetical protein